jgi:glycosyltransferase involved in cell wall biosynthesis
MSKIAIIVPMYNAAETVAATVHSVLAQTSADWELYLADDGSDDATVAVAAAAAGSDPRVKIIECGRIAHVSKVRNRVLSTVSAPLICLLDADDILRPNYLESQGRLQQETGAAVVHSAADHLVGERILSAPSNYRGPAVCDPPRMIAHLCPRNPVCAPSVLVRHDALDAVGGFSELPDHFCVWDGDLWLQMAPRFRFAYNPEPLLLYRIRAESLCHNPAHFLRNRRGEIISLERAIARGGDLSAPLMRSLRRRLSRVHSIYARLLLDERPPHRDQAREHFRAAFRQAPFADQYLPFHLLSLAGTMPPYYLHRLLRNLRGSSLT